MALKKGLSYWSFSGGLTGSKKLAEAFTEAREAGYDGIELAISATGELTEETSPSQLKAIKQLADATGIAICSLASVLTWEYRVTAADPDARNRAFRVTTKMIEVAAALGAPRVLMIPGAVDVFFLSQAEVVPYDVAYERLLDFLFMLKPIAEDHRVCVGLENVWNRFLYSPLELRDLIDKVGGEYIGSYLDTGNVVAIGYPEQWLRILGTRVKGIHLKDYRRAVGTVEGFVDLLEGDVDWPEFMKAVKEVGYDGYLVAELIPTYRYLPQARIVQASRAMDYILSLG